MATYNANGTARDPLAVAATASKAGTTSGTTNHVIRRSAWQNLSSLSSMQFNDNTLGPVFKNEGTGNEFGVEFSTEIAVRITGARVYKAPLAAGATYVTLWSIAGVKLGEIAGTWVSDAGGWRTLEFATPVAIAANTKYIISYYAAGGFWAQNDWVYNGMDFIEYPFHIGRYEEGAEGKSGASRVGGGVESGHIFPEIILPHNYYIDPIAEWDYSLPAAGPGYMNQFPNGQSSFQFPVGVFYPDPPFIEDYMSIGVNTMCGVPITGPGYREAILAAGCDVWGAADGETTVPEMVQSDAELAAHVKGYFLWDEPDMVHNYGSPDQLWTSLQEIRRVDSSRPIILNLGKWSSRSISYQWAPVGATVNQMNENWMAYGEIADIMSLDDYCITDTRMGIWAYPKMVGKLQQMSNGRLPIWSYIETCPVEGSDPTPVQVERCAWACLIAGAQGIIFFDHRFASAQYTQDFASLLHTPAMRAGVQALCAQIQSVAPALNAAHQDLVTSVDSSNTTAGPMGGTFGVPIHWTGRSVGSTRYVFVQAIRPGSTTATFTVPQAAGKSLTVLGEARTITANSSGVFVDTFSDDYEYHLYRWTV